MESHWMSYVGMATGIIGTIAGAIGAIIACVAYRRSADLERSNRKRDLHIKRNDAHLACVKLVDMLPRALKSRERVQSAIGGRRSGAMQQYQEEYDQDFARAIELCQTIPATDVRYDDLSVAELDASFVELDQTIRWLQELTEKYETSLRDDDDRRAEIRRAQS